MKISSFTKENVGHLDPKTKGFIKIEYENLNNLFNPYDDVKGVEEIVFCLIELDKFELYLIECLNDKILPKKVNEKVFLLSICFLLISKIIEQPIFKILEDIKI